MRNDRIALSADEVESLAKTGKCEHCRSTSLITDQAQWMMCSSCAEEYQQSLDELTRDVKLFNEMMLKHEQLLHERERALSLREEKLQHLDEENEMLMAQNRQLKVDLDNAKDEMEDMRQKLHASRHSSPSRATIQTQDGRKPLIPPPIQRPPLLPPRRIMPVNADLMARFRAGKAAIARNKVP